MHIQPRAISGRVLIPSSESHTLRAILFASLAEGMSIIRNALPSPDTQAMIAAVQVLGAHVEEKDSALYIRGRGSNRALQGSFLDAGNSGQVLRFVAAVAALSQETLEITGDHSLQTKRLCQPLLDALQHRGAIAYSVHGNGH